MQIIPLTTAMLDFRLAEETSTGRDWFVPYMADLIEYNPSGCFGLVDGGQPIGMITSTAYKHVGWLGWLYVAEKHRGRGWGEMLMQAGIAALEQQGVRTILLEAVEKAVSLYARIGFRESFVTEHYVLRAEDFAAGQATGVDVQVAGDVPFDSIAAFDRPIFRHDRALLLRSAMARVTFHGLIALTEGHLAGLMFSTRTDQYYHCGPLVIDPQVDNSEAILGPMFRAVIEQYRLPLYFRCPLATQDRSQPLEILGAHPAGYRTVRMYRGRPVSSDHRGILSLGCPGKG